MKGKSRKRAGAFEERRARLHAEVASLFEFFTYDVRSVLERSIQIARSICEFHEYVLLTLKSSGELVPFLSPGLGDVERGALELSDLYGETGAEYVVQEVTADTANPFFTVDGPVRSYLTIPLVIQNDVIGLLLLGNRERAAFQDEDVDLLFSLGSHLALALQNIQYYQRSVDRLRVIKALHESYRGVTSEKDLVEVISDLTREAVDTIGIGALAVYLLDRESNSWERKIFHAQAPSATSPERLEDSRIPRPIVRALEGTTLMFLKDDELDQIGLFRFSPRFSDVAILPCRGAEPFAVGFAVMEMPRLETEQYDLIELFGSQLQTLFSNAMMIAGLKAKSEELQESQIVVREYTDRMQKTNEMLEARVKELTTLHTVNLALSNKVDLDETLEFILREACSVMRAEKGSLSLLEGDELVGKSTRGIETGTRIKFKIGDGIAGWVARTGEPYVAKNISHDPVYKLSPGEKPRDETLLAVPLTMDNRIIGVLSIEREVRYGIFTADEKRLLMSLGVTAAQAIEKARAFNDMRMLHRESLEAFAQAVDTKDAYTHGHSRRVSRLSVEVGKILMLPEDEVECLERAALLHDVGKIGISNAILFKPSSLTDEEYEIMKAHAVFGEHIVKPIRRMAKEAKMIRHHHERWDGKGYPDGLKGEEIPIGSAIIGVVDAFDTITSDRPYRRGRPKEDAMEELLRCSGTQFNPLVVGAFFMFASRDDSNLPAVPVEVTDKAKGAAPATTSGTASKVDRKRA